MERFSQGRAREIIAGHDVFGYLYLLAIVLLGSSAAEATWGHGGGCRAREVPEAKEEKKYLRDEAAAAGEKLGG